MSYLWLATVIATSATCYFNKEQVTNASKVLGIHTFIEFMPLCIKLFKKYNPRLLSYFTTIDKIFTLSTLGLWTYSLYYLNILIHSNTYSIISYPYSAIYLYYNMVYYITFGACVSSVILSLSIKVASQYIIHKINSDFGINGIDEINSYVNNNIGPILNQFANVVNMIDQTQNRTVLNETTLEEIAPLHCPCIPDPNKTDYAPEYSIPSTCCVCLEQYNPKQLSRCLPCKHSFHANCIDKWLLEGSACCPICKKIVKPNQ